MLALTIKQPWATLIVQGFKDVENRTWPTNHRGPLLIHAGVKDDPGGYELADALGIDIDTDLRHGGIIGIVDLVDCVQGHPSIWSDGRQVWQWVLENPRERPFEACRGYQGLWHHGPRPQQQLLP